MKFTSKVLATIAVALALSLSGTATPIPGVLDFTGEFQFDTAVADQTGSASQEGTFFARVGGFDTPGEFSGVGVTAGTNPFTATLIEHGGGVVGAGDGFGGTASGSASGPVSDPGSHFFADTDLGDGGQTMPLTITNSSFTETYQIFFSLTFDHTVAAAGRYAFANSDLEVELDGAELHERELLSIIPGVNEFNDVPTGPLGGGGPLTESGVFLFNILVGPGGQTRTVGLDHTMEGAVEFFADPGSTSSVEASYFLSVDNVANLGQIPEPSTYVLMGSGLLALAAMRRLRKS